MIKNVPKTQPNLKTKMTDTQVAVAHQMYGSLPEQRGVSLTSTPKVGVTYANTGGNFRTDDGFKLKIDLARVPKTVLFLNHYAEGGVSDMNPTGLFHAPIPQAKSLRLQIYGKRRPCPRIVPGTYPP